VADSFLNFIIFAGIASGVAIMITLFRRRDSFYRQFIKRREHLCEDCAECQGGFLCPEALAEAKTPA
jgi:hypothetical protein